MPKNAIVATLLDGVAVSGAPLPSGNKGRGIRASLAGKVLLVALAGLAGIVGLTAGASAQDSRTTTIELRVWQHREDASSIHISARPAGGSWATLGTTPLPLDDGISQSGNWRFGDVAITVPLEAPFVTKVEVRVWQRLGNDQLIHISARPARGDWNALPTRHLPLDGISRSGSYRYGDASLEVPLPARFDVPIPTAAIEFEGDFTADERADLAEQVEEEFTRVATFFGRTFGETAPGLTVLVDRTGVDSASFGDNVINLPADFEHFTFPIAHEYVHAIQARLAPAGGEPNWISEGVATYLAMRYQEAVGGQPYEEARAYWLRSARLAEGPIESEWPHRYGAPPWYAVAMLAVEGLSQFAGDARWFQFYRELDGEASFQSAWSIFGLPLDQFYEIFEEYRLRVAPATLFFRGRVLGPVGLPVEGLVVTAKRPSDDIHQWSMYDTTEADGTFDVPAETMPHFAAIADDDGNPIEPWDEEPVVLELRVTNCEVLGYLGPNGGLVERREEARVFRVEGLTITGIVINLPVDPWTLGHATDCGEWWVGERE